MDNNDEDIKKLELDKLDEDDCNRNAYYFTTIGHTSPFYKENSFVKAPREDKPLPDASAW